MKKGRYAQEESDIIAEMRSKGKSYREIGLAIDRSKDSVASYCRNNELSGYISDPKRNPDLAFANFLEKIEKYYADRYEYVGGYADSDSPVELKCLKCANNVVFNAVVIRRGKPAICKHCTKMAKVEKKKERIRKAKERKRLAEERRRTAEEEKNRTYTLTCDQCGETFIRGRRKKKHCSKLCTTRSSWKRAEVSRRKKLKENGRIQWDITLDKVCLRDEGVCHICGEVCDKEDYVITDQGYYIAGEGHPSIDHVLPVSKGGTHTWDNVRLAHRRCNTLKRDKVSSDSFEQLELSM